MCAEQSDSKNKSALKSLCCSNGWSYGVFWGFDQRNSLLLTMKDVFHEGRMGVLIDDMLLQVHMLGGGIIGQTAFTKKHRWMFSDTYYGGQNHIDSIEFQDDSEFRRQFSSGIKTIAVISVEPKGVLQFGSTQKILESAEFVYQTKELFCKMENEEGVISSFLSDIYGQNGPFSSLASPGNSELENLHLFDNVNCMDVMETSCSSQAFSFSPLIGSVPETMTRLQIHGLNPKPDDPFLGFDTPCASSLSNDDSTLTSLMQELSNEIRPERSPMNNLSTFEELFRGIDETTPHPTDDISRLLNPSPECSRRTTVTNDVAQSMMTWHGQSHGMATTAMNNDVARSTMAWHNQSRCTTTVNDDVPRSTITWRNENPTSNALQFGAKDIFSNRSGGLFSKLGLEHLFDGISSSSNSTSSSTFVSGSSFEDRFSSTKRRKIGTTFSENMYNSDRRNDSVLKNGVFPKSEIHSLMGSQPKNAVKGTKKKAKPGTRPRPKDRQMIHDRVTELRDLIPNGQKMSIDCLLNRTIKHLVFLQGVTKHAGRLREIDEPKKRKTLNKDSGITWACEVGEETMVCPLIVEDLKTSGQMLIEMQCEEQGFFLEMVDIIRGFGLIILKGVMEVRESKLWAHFIVETEEHRRVTRHEIFSSLVQLLQLSAPNNCQQFAVPLPVSLANTMRCTNL